MKNEGFIKMWRGVSTVILGCVPAHAAYFSIYEYSKRHFQIESNKDFYFFSTAITGILATSSHDIIITPMDVIKQRIQLNRVKGPIGMLKHVVGNEGIISLYRSLPITLIMNMPQAVLFMTFYENFKSQLYPDGNVSMYGFFTCAGVSAALAAGLTTPLDVIKTRLQTQRETCPSCGTKFMQSQGNLSKPRYGNIQNAISLIYLEDGLRGFLRGMVPRMMFFLPGAAVSWSVYEHVKSLLL
mmetsp:Transcript_18903/g.18907  ORF Transcript_18903/g.18907 Transcript_18903/m.18907 type:complete len:241 (+) Transcript_18903:177-899(+)